MENQNNDKISEIEIKIKNLDEQIEKLKNIFSKLEIENSRRARENQVLRDRLKESCKFHLRSC
jgi:regulator of replication initiation timing